MDSAESGPATDRCPKDGDPLRPELTEEAIRLTQPRSWPMLGRIRSAGAPNGGAGPITAVVITRLVGADSRGSDGAGA